MSHQYQTVDKIYCYVKKRLDNNLIRLDVSLPMVNQLEISKQIEEDVYILNFINEITHELKEEKRNEAISNY